MQSTLLVPGINKLRLQECPCLHRSFIESDPENGIFSRPSSTERPFWLNSRPAVPQNGLFFCFEFPTGSSTERLLVRTTLPADPLEAGPFGQFRSFQHKSRKNGFFGRLENQNCRKEDFWQKTRAFIFSALLKYGFVSRIELNGVCPGIFPVRKNVEKIYVACNRPQSMFWTFQSESL